MTSKAPSADEQTPPIKEPVTPQPPAPEARELTIISEPSGAKVYYKEVYIGTSPQKLKIEDKDAQITLELEGFKRLTTSAADTDQEFLTLKLEPLPAVVRPDKSKRVPDKTPAITKPKTEEPPKQVEPQPKTSPAVVKEEPPKPKVDPKPSLVLPQ